MRAILAYAIACAVVCSSSVFAQLTNRSSVLDGFGARSTGGSFTHVGAGGQPGGIATSSGGTLQNQAGFLNTFFLKPGLDTDGDGIADEADADNDNDQLADATEIGGNAFAPTSPTLVNVADTDGDGMIDGWEAVAGTDPSNTNALLKLIAISNAGPDRAVAWLARGNNEKTYVVRSKSTLTGGFNAVVFSNTVAGGAAPWHAVTTSVTDATTSNTLYYAIEVLP